MEKCKTCGGKNTVSSPITHPTNPNLDTWDTRVCPDCGGLDPTQVMEEHQRALGQQKAVPLPGDVASKVERLEKRVAELEQKVRDLER